MKPTPTWVVLLAVAVQVGGLGLCVWAMESAIKRDRALSGRATGPNSLPETATAPPPPFGATPPTWSPGTPPGSTA